MFARRQRPSATAGQHFSVISRIGWAFGNSTTRGTRGRRHNLRNLMIVKRFYRARLQSIIGATQKRHALILRTSSDFIVRQLLRSSGPLKAKARHPASQALAVLAAQVMAQHKGTSTSTGQLLVWLPQVPSARVQCKCTKQSCFAGRSITVVAMLMASRGRHAGCALISRLSRGHRDIQARCGPLPCA